MEKHAKRKVTEYLKKNMVIYEPFTTKFWKWTCKLFKKGILMSKPGIHFLRNQPYPKFIQVHIKFCPHIPLSLWEERILIKKNESNFRIYYSACDRANTLRLVRNDMKNTQTKSLWYIFFVVFFFHGQGGICIIMIHSPLQEKKNIYIAQNVSRVSPYLHTYIHRK